MYIVVNKIPGEAKGMVAAFKQAAPDMKKFSGYLGMEIWESEDGSLQAVSRWTSKEALAEYTSHAAFQQHHGGGSSHGDAGSHGHSHGDGSSKQAHVSDQIAYYNSEVID